VAASARLTESAAPSRRSFPRDPDGIAQSLEAFPRSLEPSAPSPRTVPLTEASIPPNRDTLPPIAPTTARSSWTTALARRAVRQPSRSAAGASAPSRQGFRTSSRDPASLRCHPEPFSKVFAPATEGFSTTAEGSRLFSEGLPSSTEGAETSPEARRTIRQSRQRQNRCQARRRQEADVILARWWGGSWGWKRAIANQR
jgi:hypothetical protein